MNCYINKRPKLQYGRELNVGVSFIKREIFATYDYACDSGKRKSLAIKYCPFCGRKLYKAESEG